jgi:hypothetical protein
MTKDLRIEMLLAHQFGDRPRGERIRALMQEEAVQAYARQVELINTSFYRLWQDWGALKEYKVSRRGDDLST